VYSGVLGIREFWNVSTRPATARDGYGRTVEITVRWVRSFERILQVLPETPANYARWRQIVEQYVVIGVQVHDANLVAVADAYGASAVITLNPGDFARYSTMRVFTPIQTAPSGS
jgi:predicted nucleic acid-binding protein